MGSETVLIINPASAGGRTLRRWPAIKRALEAQSVDHDVRFTTEPFEATAITREELRGGRRRVVAVGGDGTLNEVVNGYFDPTTSEPIAPDAQLGLIPSGTGGDFRRTAGLDTADAAVTALARGHVHRLDAGRINTIGPHSIPRHFINIADWGVGGEVVARVNNSRHKAGGARGTAVFLLISLRELLGYGVRGVELCIDGTRMQRRVSNVIVANGRYFGGGMKIAPRARLDDGLFDVVLIGEMSRTRTVTGIPRIYRGSHLTMPGIEVHRARHVIITPTDSEPLQFEAEGELIGSGGATVTCLPGAIPFVVR